MRFHKKIFSGLAALLLLAGMLHTFACKRDPVYIGDLDPDPVDTTGNNGGGNGNPNAHPCDPDSIYFNQQILPILTSNCAMPGCHDAQSHEEGIILDNYQNVRNTGKIKLSNPADSKIYKVLNLTDPGDRMPPPPAAALPQAQRDLILKWIQQGALNLVCDADCDTTNVTFAASVMPVIESRCKGCHSGASPQGGIALTNHAQVKATVSNGTLWGSITHAGGFTAMPYPAGSAKMPDCDIRKIKIWIDAGAPNN
jgi:uncharacterized membrane protein